jgi:PEP-CTERM motif
LGAALTLSASLVFGQASFELANNHPPLVDAPVFDAQGIPLAGTNYLAELWGAASPESLTPLVVVDEGNAREIVAFIDRGYFFSPESRLCVAEVAPRGWAWLQVRAWDARLGATYEQVAALGIGGYGESPLFYAQGHEPFREPPEPGAPLIGLQSFSLRPIPEPSTWGLLVVGGVLSIGFVLRRRRV